MCKKFNYQAMNCKEVETFTQCMGEHKLKDYKAEHENLKCINCISYNK